MAACRPLWLEMMSKGCAALFEELSARGGRETEQIDIRVVFEEGHAVGNLFVIDVE